VETYSTARLQRLVLAYHKHSLVVVADINSLLLSLSFGCEIPTVGINSAMHNASPVRQYIIGLDSL